jgi:hypothetical protein
MRALLRRDAVPDPLLSDRRAGSHDLGRRRIDLRDLDKAIGLGIVRPGDERSAHFCAVPAGYDAKPKRLFCLDVTRREILHGVICFQVGDRCSIERRGVFVEIERREPFSVPIESRRRLQLLALTRLLCANLREPGPPRQSRGRLSLENTLLMHGARWRQCAARRTERPS